MTLRRCYKCRESKPDSDFYRHVGRSTGFSGSCKPCHVDIVSSGYTQDERRIKNRKANLKRKYGFTLDLYEEMCAAQDYKCFICGDETFLVVDHCHSTGVVRGLLCVKCNSGLGMFKDDPKALLNAVEYLQSQS